MNNIDKLRAANAKIAELEAQNKAVTEQVAEMTRNNIRVHKEFKELESRLAEAESRANMWEHNYAISSPKRYALIQRTEAAENRVATLEAELGEASQLLDKPIGYNVGLLCVVEAIKIVLARTEALRAALARIIKRTQDCTPLVAIDVREIAQAALAEQPAE